MKISWSRTLGIALGVAIAFLLGAVAAVLLLRRPVPREPAVVRWPSVVTTLAGVGAPGLAEGLGRQAAFADPYGVAVNAAGDTYVADGGDNNVIWRIDSRGQARIIAGGTEGFADGTGRAAQFNTPSGLAIDAHGDLIVADTGNHAIRRVTSMGAVTTIAGGGEPGRADGRGREAMFNGPVAIAVAPDGSLVVADTYNDCIRRIAADGQVMLVAGGGATGYRDGPAGTALFDTPSGVAVDDRGVIYVADTGNDAIRRIDTTGDVATVGLPGSAGAPAEHLALFRPLAVQVLKPASASADSARPSAEGPALAIGDAAGRLTIVAADAGRVMAVVGDNAGFADGSGSAARLRAPAGIGVAPDGSLRVTDVDNYVVRRITRRGDPIPGADIDFTPVPWLTPSTLKVAAFPWPLDPQHAWHELAATLGEARGSLGGDGRERLHSGIDVRGSIGAIVRAVYDEKVSRPIAAVGFDSATESLRTGVMTYVHVRVGRTAGGTLLAPSRFAFVTDERGQPIHVRVRRGTRFRVGDVVGTVNKMAHVHLEVGPRAGEINPLLLPLEGFHDRVPPTIVPKGITIYAETGERIPAPRKGPVPLTGRVAIVAEAYDRVDGNGTNRRLGVYSLGYQLLGAHGNPAPGFEQPRMTIEFDRMPERPGAPHLIYADGSGITVYGARTTRFRYIVTNRLRDGEVTQDLLDTSQLAPGDYVLRVIAADQSGNQTKQDLAVRIVSQP